MASRPGNSRAVLLCRGIIRRSAMKRVLIFGISGATWEIIDPLLVQGRLPAFKRLIDDGCRATLPSERASDDKHFRPQIAWPTIATGVLPERHGVMRFYHTSDDIRMPTMFERLSQGGRRVGMFGWPISWPVKPVNGFLVPGYDGRDASTWPAELSFLRTLDRRQEAAREAGEVGLLDRIRIAESFQLLGKLRRAGVGGRTFAHLALHAADVMLRAPAELRPLIIRAARLRINVGSFLKLCAAHHPDVAAFVTFLADYAAHRFWLFREPHRFGDAPATNHPRLRSAIDDAYVAIDRALERILDDQRPDVVIVLSEHGMAAEEPSVEIGPWHYILRPNQLKEFVGIDACIPAVPIARWIALRPPAGQVDDVARRFERVRVDGTELPLFQVYMHRGEVIVKLALRRETSPSNLESIVARFDDRTAPFTALTQRFGRRRSAMHARDGVLMVQGSGIRRGSVIEGAQLIDIAPTVLKLAGVETSGGLDGRVLDVFG
jgi:hypothetical protein